MHSPPSTESATAQDPTYSRRVVLRAAGMLGAMLAAGGPMALARKGRLRAQSDLDGPTFLAGEWSMSSADEVVVATEDGFTTIETGFPITGVAAHWPAATGDWPVIEIQLSLDNITYTESYFAHADSDLGRPAGGGRIHSTMVASGGANYVRFRVLDNAGNVAELPDLVIAWVNAEAGPTLDDLPSVSIATSDPAVPPTVISRAEWGADESLRFRNGVELWPTTYQTVQHAIVHHSETSNAQNPLEAIRSIYYFHAITRDWGDIAYNFLIDRFGNIYEGRVGGQNAVGSHASLHNQGSAGICLIGNFLLQDTSVQARASLVAILAWVVRDLDPLGSADFWNTPNLPTICAHRDVNDTTCPGDFAYDDLPAIRNQVAQVLAMANGTLPGGLTIGDTVVVVTGDETSLNLRATPGLSGEIIAELPNGSFGVVIDGPESDATGHWYQLSTAGGIGWCTAEFLELAPPGLEGGGRFTVGETVAVDADSLNLYGNPNSNSSILYRVYRNHVGTIASGPKFASGAVWYQFHEGLITGGFATGWTREVNLRHSTDPPSGPIPEFITGDVIRTTAALNLRSGPSTSTSILRVLGAGTTAMVLAGPLFGSGHTWYQVRAGTSTGFVSRLYIQSAAPPSTTPPPGATTTPAPGTTTTPAPATTTAQAPPTMTTPPPGQPAYLPGDVLITTANLRLRSSPSTSGGILGTLAMNTLATVVSGPQTASGYEWWQIATSLGTGWAAGDWLRKSNSAPPPPPGARFQPGDAVMTTTSLNLRSAPSLTGTIIALMATGTVGSVVAGPESGSGITWWRITVAAGTGWASDAYLNPTTQSTPPPPPPAYLPGDFVRTTASLRLRQSPSTSAATLKIMPTGAISTVISGPTFAGGYTWWRIQNGSDTGWAAGEYLRPA